MRSHHAPPRPPPELSWVAPQQMSPEHQHWLIYDATWHTNWALSDYRTCDTCGHPIGLGQCIAVAKPPDRKPVTACWTCMISILLFRGALDPDGTDWPPLYGSGRYVFEMAGLRPHDGQHRGS